MKSDRDLQDPRLTTLAPGTKNFTKIFTAMYPGRDPGEGAGTTIIQCDRRQRTMGYIFFCMILLTVPLFFRDFYAYAIEHTLLEAISREKGGFFLHAFMVIVFSWAFCLSFFSYTWIGMDKKELRALGLSNVGFSYKSHIFEKRSITKVKAVGSKNSRRNDNNLTVWHAEQPEDSGKGEIKQTIIVPRQALPPLLALEKRINQWLKTK